MFILNWRMLIPYLPYYRTQRAKPNINTRQVSCRLFISHWQASVPSAFTLQTYHRRYPMTFSRWHLHRMERLWKFRTSSGLKFIDIQWITAFGRWRWFYHNMPRPVWLWPTRGSSCHTRDSRPSATVVASPATCTRGVQHATKWKQHGPPWWLPPMPLLLRRVQQWKKVPRMT